MPSEGWRRNDEQFDDPKPPKDLAFVERLRGVGNRHDKSPAGVAIGWTLRPPTVSAAIVSAADLRLSDDEIGASLT